MLNNTINSGRQKVYRLYRIILISFILLLLFSSLLMGLYLHMRIVPVGFLYSTLVLVFSLWVLSKGKLLLSVHSITQFFPLFFIFLSVFSKLQGEGNSLVFYIAPRFGIMLTLLLPFVVLGTQNKKRLFLSFLPALFFFLTFDLWHRIFGLTRPVEYTPGDYPLVFAGLLIILILAGAVIYFLQNLNETYEQTVTAQRDQLQLTQKN